MTTSVRRRAPRVRPGVWERLADERWLTVALSVLLVAIIGGFWYWASRASAELWVPVVVLLVLAALLTPVVIITARGDRRLRQLLVLALILKLFCVGARFYVNEYLYDGQSDAGVYHEAGKVLYDNVRGQGRWSLDGAKIDQFPQESRSVGYVTGALYLVFGTSHFGGYLVFSAVGWIGLLLIFRSFRLAYPNAPPYLAAALIFFLPSMLYWPSSIGKDAIMLGTIGLFCLGACRLLIADRPVRGLVWMGLATWLMSLVRPHLLVILVVALAGGLLTRRTDLIHRRWQTTMRVVGVVLLIVSLPMAMSRVTEMFGDDSSGNVSVSSVFDQTREQTEIGGSAFDTQPVRSPLDFPLAALSVTFRPFPFEATSLPALISALEGMVLLALTVLSARWVWRVVPAAARHPYAGFCAGYVVGFVIAFSNIGNAGILARQRTQMFPVLMVLVAAAREQDRVTNYDAAEREAGDRDSDLALEPVPSPT